MMNCPSSFVLGPLHKKGGATKNGLRTKDKGPRTKDKGPMTIYLKQLFSESGEASFSRVGSFLALICSLAWLSYIVWETHAVPSVEGLTIFISSLYALGKAGETIQRVLGGKG
jgi:hypothetical protein